MAGFVNRMPKAIRSESRADETLEDVGDNDEEVGRESIALSEAITTTQPGTRDTIQDDRRVTGDKDVSHPSTPEIIETSGAKDGDETVPVNGVERLTKVDFENHRRSFANVAATNNVRSIHNVFGDAPTGEKPSLVRVNKGMD